MKTKTYTPQTEHLCDENKDLQYSELTLLTCDLIKTGLMLLHQQTHIPHTVGK